MNKTWILALGIVLALLLGVGGLVLAQSTKSDYSAQNPGAVSVNIQNQQTGIWVNGVGTVKVTPDTAILSVGVEAQAATVKEAQAQAAAAMEKAVAALKAKGVSEKDIQTQYYNISKMTRWDDRGQTEIVLGYQVTNTVTVKIREIAKAGDIIDAVGMAGGDQIRINGVSFTVDDTTKVTREAREKAMADAKAKAEQMAKLSGVRLGKVTYVSESSYYPYATRSSMPTMDAMEGAKTVISPGETEITINVQVVYGIAE